MVPTNTIRQQTLEALKEPRHPYREAVDNAFEGRVAVFDISDIEQIRPQDLTEKVCIVVSTLATLRVNNTEGRKVYAHKEAFEPHFAKIPQTVPGLERIEEGPDKGKVKFSFANLMQVHRPLLIVDEAHNALTGLIHEVWGTRIRPECIIEFTATPVKNNVLYRVTASQVKAAEMIKLPIMLTEHKNWQEALHDAKLNRDKLAELAGKDKDYIRPIALIQAESKDRELTVDVVKTHLIEKEMIDPEKVAVATGAVRELDGINLFDPNCKIEYIITMEALKEGWDCSFAYVFVSVANIHSTKDVEQYLGRVLRMPYAKSRTREELNWAYAHVSSSSFAEAASLLHDRLVARMGFDEEEVMDYIQPGLPRTEGSLPLQDTVELELDEEPDLAGLEAEEIDRVQVVKEPTGKYKTVIKGDISDKLEKSIVGAVSATRRSLVKATIKTHREYVKREPSPAERGEKFTVPNLCVMVQGELEFAEKDVFWDAKGWDILDYSTELSPSEFDIKETATTFEIDLKGNKLTYSLVDASRQIDLSHIKDTISAAAFIQSLDKEVRKPHTRQERMIEFLRRVVKSLTKDRGIDLSILIRFKYPLIKALEEKIKDYRKQAYAKGYQETLFGSSANVETSYDIPFTYSIKHGAYAPRWHYSGQFEFKKRFYHRVGELKSSGEEFDCAQAIEGLKAVKHWVRNLERQPESSFSLPTSTDRFYPDFVAELNDGRILVVEYKGAHLADGPDSDEKKNIGALWEAKSNGKGLFIMAVKRDSEGRDVYKQLLDKVQGS
jgi:type III restriction enzyme